MLRDDVLALLRQREGEPLSGEAMSRTLGVSRAAVWKAMETLRQEGYEISSAPRRGYWLEKSPDLLSPGELSRPDRRVGRSWCAWTRWILPTMKLSAGRWGRCPTA